MTARMTALVASPAALALGFALGWLIWSAW
jgi:hypothetical protein